MKNWIGNRQWKALTSVIYISSACQKYFWICLMGCKIYNNSLIWKCRSGVSREIKNNWKKSIYWNLLIRCIFISRPLLNCGWKSSTGKILKESLYCQHNYGRKIMIFRHIGLLLRLIFHNNAFITWIVMMKVLQEYSAITFATSSNSQIPH